LSHDTETPPNFLVHLQDVLFKVGQMIDIRLALLIGLLAFFVAVGFDSSGNQAEAAHLLRQHQASLVPNVTPADGDTLNRSSQLISSKTEAVSSNASVATARRLRHGTLTSAVMTGNRLTQAHFFTDLPSGQ